MKTIKYLTMAALALMTAACSNDDNDLTTQQPQKAEGITITAQLAPKTNGAATRAVADNGDNKITVTWAKDEQIAILYEVGSTKYVAEATITDVDGSGAATITFIVEAGTPDNTACTLVYPYSAAKDDHTGVKDAATLLAAQDGVLDGDLDVRVGAGTIQTTTPSLDVTTQPAAQFAIFKFTLSGVSVDDTHPLVIKDNASNTTITTVTPASSATSVYVAMPAATSKAYKFVVTTADNKYIKSGTATIDAGKYYQTTLTMEARYPLALANATEEDLGSVIGADGNIYLNMTAATGASPATTAVAMIAYKSETAGESLAIQLNDSPSKMNWSTACSYTSYPSITGNPGTWRLPSKADWQNMFLGCAKDGDDSDASSDNKLDPIAGFKEKIGATGITWNSNPYWSSTDSGSKAWNVDVYLRGSYAEAVFGEQLTSDPYLVLGCLAF